MARFYSRPRDDQRSAVYKAERAAFQGRLQQQDVSTPERMRRRLDQILLSPWFLATYPKTAARQIGLEFGRLGGANANESRIRLGRNAFAMQEWILIHELSHVVVRREIPSKYRVGGVDYTEYAQARRNLNWSTGERIIVDAPRATATSTATSTLSWLSSSSRQVLPTNCAGNSTPTELDTSREQRSSSPPRGRSVLSSLERSSSPVERSSPRSAPSLASPRRSPVASCVRQVSTPPTRTKRRSAKSSVPSTLFD